MFLSAADPATGGRLERRVRRARCARHLRLRELPQEQLRTGARQGNMVGVGPIQGPMANPKTSGRSRGPRQIQAVGARSQYRSALGSVQRTLVEADPGHCCINSRFDHSARSNPSGVMHPRSRTNSQRVFSCASTWRTSSCRRTSTSTCSSWSCGTTRRRAWPLPVSPTPPTNPSSTSSSA